MADSEQLFIGKPMYRRPKFLEILLDIRREMAHEADYDVELFAEFARSGSRPSKTKRQVPDIEGLHQANKSETTSKSRHVRKPVSK